MKLLEQITSPSDLKSMNIKEMEQLSGEIRDFLIQSVSQTGGHLSSNLGTIELTLALHKVFESPQDQIVWDVGHQCYTHKILTGRKSGFSKLRKKGGLSGFPKPEESVHDIFIAGHGTTSLSAAIGLAQAKRMKKEDGKVIAIIGDGAFTGGMIYEGMNNIRTLNNLIVILNDNEMSISKNVGAIAQYFTRLRTAPHYFKAKKDVQFILERIPLVGESIKVFLQKIKTSFRRSLYHSTMFEDMGFHYVGLIDGHHISELCAIFSAYRMEQTAPVLLHIRTIKGKGFLPAEKNPGEFHGVSSFNPDEEIDPELSPAVSFSTVFGKKLTELADENDKICAITAAMKYGTGLQFFYKKHKSRFFDVGMAEQHAVTFSAGLAVNGMKPVVAIYSTFLQRAFDQIIHDVNLMKADVLFAIDRAGFVPADGDTHQGVYDTSFLTMIDGMTVYSVSNYAELEYWLETLFERTGPKALRYPRGAQDSQLEQFGCSKQTYDVYFAKKKANIVIITYGVEVLQAYRAQQLAQECGLFVDVVKMVQIYPISEEFSSYIMQYDTVIFAEEAIHSGGIAEHLGNILMQKKANLTYRAIGAYSRDFITASADELRQHFHLDEQALFELIKELSDT